MARFLKLTHAHVNLVGKSIAFNIDHIVSIAPFSETSHQSYTGAGAWVNTSDGADIAVQESYDFILNSLPI